MSLHTVELHLKGSKGRPCRVQSIKTCLLECCVCTPHLSVHFCCQWLAVGVVGKSVTVQSEYPGVVRVVEEFMAACVRGELHKKCS